MNHATGGTSARSPRLQTYGPLRCIVIDGGPRPTIPIILCHGYGAPGHDLAGLGLEWCQMLGDDAASVRFIFPEAPISLADQGMPEGRAWWALNMARLLDLAGADRFDELHDEEPPGIQAARTNLLACIHEIFDELGLGQESAQPVWGIGGFSQGAMVTLDTVLRESITPPTALFQFSGTLICRPQWQQHLQRLSATKILQSHGTVDPILPFASALRLQELFQTLKANDAVANNQIPQIQFHKFDGPHTIDPGVVQLAAKLIGYVASQAKSTTQSANTTDSD